MKIFKQKKKGEKELVTYIFFFFCLGQMKIFEQKKKEKKS